jgi:polyhydroxyalkanoate synthesis regulator protein
MRKAVQQTMGNFFPFGIEEVGRQNVAMMERAMSLFTPFVPGATEPPRKPEDEIETLRAEIERLKSELAAKKG